MSEDFHEWLCRCPTTWTRHEIDDDGSTYWFKEDEKGGEDEE